MKHKAQDSLDTFKKCMRNITNYTFNEKEKCDFKTKDTENMQNLIDSQLTEEEIGTINTALNHLEVDYELDKTLIMYRTKGLERIESIRNKLNERKEMWCEYER